MQKKATAQYSQICGRLQLLIVYVGPYYFLIPQRSNI